MDPMTEEIKLAISKNLPAQIGDALRQRLTDAGRFEEEAKREKASSIYKDGVIADLNAKLAKHADIDKREKDLAEGKAALAEAELAVLKREVAMDRTIAAHMTAGAEACVSAVHRALALMNPGTDKADKTWNFDGSFSIPWPSSNYPMRETVNVSLTKRP